MNLFSDIHLYSYNKHILLYSFAHSVLKSRVRPPCSPLNLERANFYPTAGEITMVTDLYIALIDLIRCRYVPALDRIRNCTSDH